MIRTNKLKAEKTKKYIVKHHNYRISGIKYKTLLTGIACTHQLNCTTNSYFMNKMMREYKC